MAASDPVSTGANGAVDPAGEGPQVAALAQYVKDLSVENPSAPQVYQWNEQPQLDVQFNIGARAIADELHEVELKTVITARAEAGTAYVVDLSYCGLIGMRNMPDDQKHAFTYAEAPRVLFPFARRVVADAVRDAGFPPLLLDPIDFNGLYVQQLQQKQADTAASTPVGEA